jgi:hypothetical protein
LKRKLLILCKYILFSIVSFPLALIFLFLALISRYTPRKIDIGLGPEPMINNVYHKRALNFMGYSSETFVNQLYFITSQFDVICTLPHISSLYLGARALFRYKCLYIYFNGGPFAWTPLRTLEPYLYKAAGIKVLVMPYGGDIQDMALCRNLLFKNAICRDYPGITRKRKTVAYRVDRWSRHADHIISGCDWVDYMWRWDTLCLAHFSVDTDELTPPEGAYESLNTRTITILHAPNHTAIKGTQFFIKAVEDLKAEGYSVELKLVQKMPNHELRKLIRAADIIADQLVIGCYAMFAIEGMAAGKPVLCYLREDLRELYEFAGLIDPGEIPLVNCDHQTVKESIRHLLDNLELIPKIGQASRSYVVKHHSIQAIGRMFDKANSQMGISPSHPASLLFV